MSNKELWYVSAEVEYVGEYGTIEDDYFWGTEAEAAKYTKDSFAGNGAKKADEIGSRWIDEGRAIKLNAPVKCTTKPYISRYISILNFGSFPVSNLLTSTNYKSSDADIIWEDGDYFTYWFAVNPHHKDNFKCPVFEIEITPGNDNHFKARLIMPEDVLNEALHKAENGVQWDVTGWTLSRLMQYVEEMVIED